MQHDPATRIRRLDAACIDILPFLPFYFVDGWVESLSNQHLLFVYYTLSWQLGWFYFAFCHQRFGQTLGKRHYRIKLVSFLDGEKITWRQALIRESPYIAVIAVCTLVWIAANVAEYAGAFTERWSQWTQRVFVWTEYAGITWALLELITMAFHPLRRSLRDLLADTIVVRLPPSGGQTAPAPATDQP